MGRTGKEKRQSKSKGKGHHGVAYAVREQAKEGMYLHTPPEIAKAVVHVVCDKRSEEPIEAYIEDVLD
jgi:hypothetical protein